MGWCTYLHWIPARLREVAFSGSMSPMLGFSAKVTLMDSWEPPLSQVSDFLETPPSIHTAPDFYSFFWPSGPLSCLSLNLILATHPPSFSFSSSSPFPPSPPSICPCNCFVSPSKCDSTILAWAFLLTYLLWVCGVYHEYIPCTSFWVWITSLNMIFSSSIYSLAKFLMSSFLRAE